MIVRHVRINILRQHFLISCVTTTMKLTFVIQGGGHIQTFVWEISTYEL